ncbi:AraC family transcriptional regulator [Microbispora sp. KK1-11]|nr:AraC family transcriptional regulator [Microbispora sp. KK1-11]
MRMVLERHPGEPAHPSACDQDMIRRRTVDELAHRAGMSRRAFIRRLQQETDTSPTAWPTAARIDWARERAG